VVLVSDGFVEQTDASLIRKLRDRGITIESVVSDGGSLSPLDELGTVTRLVNQ
jgi:biotin operon repressor